MLIGTWPQRDDRADDSQKIEPVSRLEAETTTAVKMPIGIESTWDKFDNPAQDGWETEVLAQETKEQLKILGALIVNSQQLDRAKLATIIDRDFTCQPLLPTELTTAFDDGYVMIERAKTGMEAQAESSDGAHYRNRWTGGFFTVAR